MSKDQTADLREGQILERLEAALEQRESWERHRQRRECRMAIVHTLQFVLLVALIMSLVWRAVYG